MNFLLILHLQGQGQYGSKLKGAENYIKDVQKRINEIIGLCSLHLVIFFAFITQERKKLKQVEQEIQKLTTVQHPKLITIFVVKLYMPHSSGPPQLMVLSEQPPALTLHNVLEDGEFLREERVSV